ncbi:MAG: serine hydrolase [Rhodobacteraceae bacterium]|nr:serine hydrolase [Paracoccaceae bacterium]
MNTCSTALLLARLAARGGGGPDTPLGDLAALPLHADLARQSLRALLAHRTGLAANPPRAAWSVTGAPKAEAPVGPLRDRVLAPHLLDPRRPGKFRYSNLGYMLAGHIAGQIGGDPWKVLLRRGIGALRVTALVTKTGSLGGFIAAGTSGWRGQDMRAAPVRTGT